MHVGEFEVPDAIDVAKHVSGAVRVQFLYDGSETVTIHLDQSTLLTFVAQLHANVESATLTPISRDHLREGQMIAVKGASWKRLPAGGLGLVLFADVDGRKVSIPFEIPPAGVDDLRGVIAAND